MSSHREAPAISKDPVADNTDTYAFVSPNDRRHRSRSSRTICRSRRRSEARTSLSSAMTSSTTSTSIRPATVPRTSPTSSSSRLRFAIRTRSSTTRARSTRSTARTGTAVSSTRSRRSRAGPLDRCWPATSRARRATSGRHRRPTTHNLATEAVHDLGGGRLVFAGQRTRRFLRRSRRDLRSRRPATVPEPAHRGDGQCAGCQRHQRIRRPLHRAQGSLLGSHERRPDARPIRWRATRWSASGRRPAGKRSLIREPGTGTVQESGSWVQVSRLGNPLFNEVIVPMGKKDLWNSLTPADDRQFAQLRPAPRARRVTCPSSTPECSRTWRS